MQGACVRCMSTDTELFRGDDGRFRKRCNNPGCGHVGGPYTEQAEPAEEQAGLDSF